MSLEYVSQSSTLIMVVAAVFCLLHLLSSFISNRIAERSDWTRYIEDGRHDETNDTGPK